MEQIKLIIEQFQKRLVALGFDQEQIATILYEIVLIASAKLSESDLSFLSPEELQFVSSKDLLQLTPEQLQEVSVSTPNLVKYLDIYSQQLQEAIKEFDQIVDEVSKEELPQSH